MAFTAVLTTDGLYLLCFVLNINSWSLIILNSVSVGMHLSLKLRTLVNLVLCLQAGVSKLNEAKALVDELKRRAAEQSALLKTKQHEADCALQEITTSMQV